MMRGLSREGLVLLAFWKDPWAAGEGWTVVARGPEDGREPRETGPQSGARRWPGRVGGGGPRLGDVRRLGVSRPGGWRGAELVEGHALCEVLKGTPHTGRLPRHCPQREPRGQGCSLNS